MQLQIIQNNLGRAISDIWSLIILKPGSYNVMILAPDWDTHMWNLSPKGPSPFLTAEI